MFRTVAIAVAALALMVPGGQAHAQLKIGYIDAEMITSSYKRFQEAQKEAQRYEEELTRDFNKQQNELAQLKETFERQSLLMSEQRKKDEQVSIQRKQADLQKFLEDVSGQNGRLQRKTQELLQPIIQRVNEAIATVSKEKGYDFVLNTAAIAYANEQYDLTKLVLEQLEKEDTEAAKGTAAPPAGR
jgi:outer membrane protein